MENTPQEKKICRQNALARRRELSPAEVEAKSECIAAHVKNMEIIQQADTLLTYVDSKDNEVETQELITWALSEAKQVLVPVTQRGGKLQWSVLEQLEDLEPGYFEILEPKHNLRRFVAFGKHVPCLVPGVAFTKTGNRLGYGLGCFDRFISDSQPISIALAFETQLVDALPTEAHDIPMDWIVTESGVVECKK